MKKQTVTLLAFLLAASGLFFSCGNTMNKNAAALTFDSISVNKTAHLFKDATKPACNLVINMAYAALSSSDTLSRDSLNAFFLSACLGEKYMTMTPEEAVRKYTDNYINEYRTDLEPMYLKDEEDQQDEANIGAWYSYYKSIESRIQLRDHNLLVYRIDYNEYTGGAHGIYMSTFLNIDLHTLVPIRLDDLFVDNYEIPLTDLLWSQLMVDNQVTTRQELEDLGYTSTGDLEPTENFYLGKEGITFFYNVYEIAPYAMGTTQITLPYEAIQHLLSDSTKIIEHL